MSHIEGNAMTQLQTEFPFVLPNGYMDDDGNVHREGTMRLACESDELMAEKGSQRKGSPHYKPIVLLSRVIMRLGSLTRIEAKHIEGLFTSDLDYLIDICNKINGKETKVTCPSCQHDFTVGVGRASK